MIIDAYCLLEAACCRPKGKTDIAEELTNNQNGESETGKIAALFGKSLFHSDAHAEEVGLEDGEECAEFGDDMEEEMWN